ncbi:hypothetical protein [Undibacterium sp. TJN19]|uniref:hypothetical protein n=1 Tax=Undibacterium sp. TJN19 TaxID=3413055 RepID=UPI003BF01567
MTNKEKNIAIPEAQTPMAFSVKNAGLQWVKIPGVAVHEDANWELEVCRKQCLTSAEAKAFAAADDRITFFFYVKDFLILSRHQVLHAGDVVFFSGTPVLGMEAGADVYEKPASKGAVAGIWAPPDNGWISLQASMQVPSVPSPRGVFFIWPGLQPGGAHFSPVGRGVLQPVLTYCAPLSTSCAPNPDQLLEEGWWISGQYVNTENKDGPFHGCYGGPRMAVNAGDVLTCRIEYDAVSKGWLQTVLNQSTQESVTFSISLTTNGEQAQEQNIAYFCVENLHQASLSQCVSLFNIVATVAHPQNNLGQDLANLPCVENVKLSEDKRTLRIGRIVVYSPIFNAE